MLNGLWTRAFRRELRAQSTRRRRARQAWGSRRATPSPRPASEPYPAWPEPVIQDKMSVDEAKAIVAERTKPQTEWKGPDGRTQGPVGQLHHRLRLARPVLHTARSMGQRR